MPGFLQSEYFPVKGGSVPFNRQILNCSGVNLSSHWSSSLVCFISVIVIHFSHCSSYLMYSIYPTLPKPEATYSLSYSFVRTTQYWNAVSLVFILNAYITSQAATLMTNKEMGKIIWNRLSIASMCSIMNGLSASEARSKRLEPHKKSTNKIKIMP